MSENAVTEAPAPAKRKFLLLGSIGPALIVASVVVGPGSILTSSRVGTDFGYSMLWVTVVACLLMLALTALSAQLGVCVRGTLCDEIRTRAHPALAVLAGVAVFLIASCFQFGNNLGVLAAIEPIAGVPLGGRILLIVLLNLLIVGVLYGFRRLYVPIERTMLVLVGLMLLGFAANLLLAAPSLLGVMGGLIPGVPEELSGNLLPYREEGRVVDGLWPVQGLFATTLSVAGAFYLSYLVRKKGWTEENWRKGYSDSAVGICMLAAISMMVMLTAAAVLHGRVSGGELVTAAHVAQQLEPLFGKWAVALFCLGLFAGAFSSFLVNALIAGTLLSDGLGLGGDMDGRWPKILTVVALAIGMVVAITVVVRQQAPVNLIIFAQAMTVLGNPILAGVMLWLSLRVRNSAGRLAAPVWMRVAAAIALITVLVLAARTAVSVGLNVAN